jgi:hypothetical protein
LGSADLVLLDLPKSRFFLFQRLLIIRLFKLRLVQLHSRDTRSSSGICIDIGLSILKRVVIVVIARERDHRLVSRSIGCIGCFDVGFSILTR